MPQTDDPKRRRRKEQREENPKMPLNRHEEIAAEIRSRIESGEFPAGDKLPKYTELIEEYGSTRVTIGEALAILKAEGLIWPVRRLGTVVRERSGRRRVTRGNLIEHDPASGYRFPGAANGEVWKPHGKPNASWEPMPKFIADAFELESGDLAVRRRRVMSPEGEQPWDIIDTWVPRHVADEAPMVAEPSTGPGGVLRRIEEAGHGPISWDEYAMASMPTSEEAMLLKISPQMPIMRILRIGISARDGSAVECSAYAIPSDRIEIHSVLRRGPTAEWSTVQEAMA